MNIKPKDGYHFFYTTRGKAHICTNGHSILKSCSTWFSVPAVCTHDFGAIDNSDVCKHCLKDTDAWEAVEEPDMGIDYEKAYNSLLSVHAKALAAQDELAEVTKERDELMNQIRTGKMDLGYTPDQLRTILQAAPPAETLEGYTLRFDVPRVGDSFYMAHQKWRTAYIDADPCNGRKFLIRTPIVEYIEGDEITDELVQKHGRLPCEFRRVNSQEWISGILHWVIDGTEHANPYLVVNHQTYGDVYDGTFAAHCRINTADIPKPVRSDEIADDRQREQQENDA